MPNPPSLLSAASVSISDTQIDRLGSKIARQLSACFNRNERRHPERPESGAQWNRSRGRGRGGGKGRGSGTSPGKQAWARVATCYFCHAYGHTGSDHDLTWPLSADLEKRYNLGKKWHGVCSRLAEDEFGEIRPYQEVAKDVGVDLSGWDLSSIGQKRGMGIVISLKTGLDPWLPKDKIGTYIAGKDIITPDEVRATQIHEDPDDLTQPTPSRGVRGDKRTSQRSLGPQFTTEWKNSVDSRLTSLDTKVRVTSNLRP